MKLKERIRYKDNESTEKMSMDKLIFYYMLWVLREMGGGRMFRVDPSKK